MNRVAFYESVGAITTSRVCAVIVTFNRSALLLKTIDAVLNQSYPITQLVIVDNCSTDNTQQLLVESGFLNGSLSDGGQSKNFLPSGLEVLCFRSSENLGGSYGFHVALKLARGLTNEYIWMMDDDVAPDKDCLEVLLSQIDDHAGVCIPNRYGNGFEDSAKTNYDLEHLSKYCLPNKKDIVEVGQISQPFIYVRDMPFEGPLLRSELIDEVGLPNKDLFIIFDDTEYATRLTKVTKIKFVPMAKMYRMLPMAKESNGPLNWKNYYALRNEFWFDHTYGKNWIVREIRPRFYMLGRTIKWTLRGKKSDLAIAHRAFKDGMTNQLGKTVNPGEF